MGAGNKTKGRDSRRQKRQAPLAHRQHSPAPRAAGDKPPPKYLFGWYCKRRKRSNAGAPGAKPPEKLTYSLPLPRRGRGSGGWGQERSQRQGQQATKKASPPADSETARSAGDKKASPPCAPPTPPTPAPRESRPPPQYLLGWYCKRRKRFNAGAPGAKPPAKLTYSLPLPRRGRGSGGWGQESKLTKGRDSRRPKRQAPLAHRQPPRPRAARGQAPAGRAVCSPAPVPRPAQPRGCKGRSPLHETTIVSPFPGGEGGWGDGGRKSN